MYNKVILIGFVGQNPSVNDTDSGKVAGFTLATSERYSDKRTGQTKEVTEWHSVVCWRSLAEVVEKYAHKGSKLFVEGKIKSRTYENKQGETRKVTEVVASNIQLLDSRPKTEQAPLPTSSIQANPEYASQPRAMAEDYAEEFPEDDLPF